MLEVNKVYCMDNLELLKLLPDNYIDVCYIDPPFSTGKIFKTKDGIIAYEDKYSLNELIEMLKPRILEIKRVLKTTGSFYIHGDSRFIAYIKIICDDIFGINNFKNEIIWSYDRWTNSVKKFTSCHDTILFYSKSDDYIFNYQYEPFSEKSKHKGSRNSKLHNNKLEQQYTNDKRLKYMKDVWNISILNSQAKERNGYPTQKPKELIGRILKSSLPFDKETKVYSGIVLDCFAGSGTTLKVAQELKVNYVGCDNSPIAIEYINKRLNNIL